jgi:cysteinyl-tRNA synthetase
MSRRYLGVTFDIHTGGEDNIFPHHECEIAQSVAANGKPFVRTWMHARHLLVDGKKMSKSAGTLYTLADLEAMKSRDGGHFTAADVRFALISQHYRHPMNFSLEALEAARASLERLRGLRERLSECSLYGSEYPENGDQLGVRAPELRDGLLVGVRESLDDDLNVSEAFAVLFRFSTDVSGMLAKGLTKDDAKLLIEALDNVGGVLGPFLSRDGLRARAAKLSNTALKLLNLAQSQGGDESRRQLEIAVDLYKEAAEAAAYSRNSDVLTTTLYNKALAEFEFARKKEGSKRYEQLSSSIETLNRALDHVSLTSRQDVYASILYNLALALYERAISQSGEIATDDLVKAKEYYHEVIQCLSAHQRQDIRDSAIRNLEIVNARLDPIGKKSASLRIVPAGSIMIDPADASSISFLTQEAAKTMESHALDRVLLLLEQLDAIRFRVDTSGLNSHLSPMKEKEKNEIVRFLVAARFAAKKAKDFALADRIRAALASAGVTLEDTPQGVRWKMK